MDTHSLPPVPLPLFHPVHALRSSAPRLKDVPATTTAALDQAFPEKFPAGSPVAVAVGSRGIVNYAKVVRAAVDFLKSRGAKPFIVPAMGSHGGATAEAQRAVLAEYGIHEEAMGAPVVSSMETVSLGTTKGGIEVFMDRHAFEAGRVLMVNRVKVHTDFQGHVESGMMKMVAIGLGKLDGARRFHMNAMRIGFEAALLEMARHSLASGKIIGGVAILENDSHETAEVAAVAATEMESKERRLIERARDIRPRLPFEKLDLLIIDEMGKNISGAGMDTRVIGRSVHPSLDQASPTGTMPGHLDVQRIFVRDLTHETEGNACGVGLADVTHERVFRKMNFETTYTNAVTSLAYVAARLPMWFKSDRSALDFLLRNMGLPAPEELRAVRIVNTLAVDAFLASPACAKELASNPNYKVLEPVPLEFNEKGDIVSEVRELAGAH